MLALALCLVFKLATLNDFSNRKLRILVLCLQRIAGSLQMRDMNHENVNPFIGLCTDPPNVSIAMVYCFRRSILVIQYHHRRTLSPCLRHQLPTSLRQPHPSLSVSDLPVPPPTTSSPFVDSPLSPSKTLHSFTPGSKLPLSQIFPTIDFLPASGPTPWTLWLDLFLFLVPCGRLSCLPISFWAHVNIVYRIVSYHETSC